MIDYQIQLSAGTGDFNDIENDWSSTKYTYNDVSPGDTYTFRVRARNSLGYSSYSTELPVVAATVP